MVSIQIVTDRSSPVPLHRQIYVELERAIACGEIRKGDYLDNELDLAAQWQVSRPTVRRSIQELVDEGVLVRRRGVGTQVVNAQMRRPVRLSSLYDDLRNSGRVPRSIVTSLRCSKAEREVTKALGIPRDTEVVCLERLRYAGRTPLAILRNFLIVDAAGDLTVDQLQSSGLYELLREKGVFPRIATQVIGAKAASEQEAHALDLAVGAPLLTMRRVMQDQLGRTIELGVHTYDAANYTVETTVVDTLGAESR